MIDFVGGEMTLNFDRFDLDTYALFLKAKALPEYRVECDPEALTYKIHAPARFAGMLGVERPPLPSTGLPLASHLFDDQIHIVRLALDAKRFAVWSDCGLGKGLLEDAPVLTPTGWTPIGRLEVGDLVIGRNGKPYPVEGVFHRGELDVYRVAFSDGVSVLCDGDHLWNVKSHNDVARDKEWRTMSVRELMGTKLHYGAHGQSRTWQIPLVDPIDFEAVDHPIHPYIMGVLLGDGALTQGSVSWTKPDVAVASRVAAHLPEGVSLTRSDSPDRCSTWRLTTPRVEANPVTDELRLMGLMSKYSHEKFVPSQYLYGTAAQRLELLQGLMDTDGYSGESPEFSSSSRALADAVIHLVQSLGGTARLGCKPEPTYRHNSEERIGKPSWRVTMTLPPGINPFSIPRKADQFKTPSRGLGRWIDSIEPEGRAKTVCIKVGSPDSLFVTEHFLVTHNTMIEWEFARQVVHITGRKVLMVSLNEVVPQLISEAAKFYPDVSVTRLHTQAEMIAWCGSPGTGVGITNYEKFNPKSLEGNFIPECGKLAGVILDESSRLKGGGDSRQKKVINASCKGVEYKLSCTATPAPNDSIEFTSQATFLEKVKTDADIIWSFFTRDTATNKRTVRPHARAAFFDFMASWSVYLKNPKRFGWRLDLPEVPEPIYLTHKLPCNEAQRVEQRKILAGPGNAPTLFATRETNAIERNKLAQVARGFRYRKTKTGRERIAIESAKPPFVADLARSEVADGHQVLLWTTFDEESAILARLLEGESFALLTGDTADEDRIEILDRFRDGEIRCLVSRPKMLAYGMNFQFTTSMIWSGFTESFEEVYQGIRRAVRHGQMNRVRVHFPYIEELEGETFLNLMSKSRSHTRDTDEMEDNYLRSFLKLQGKAA